MTSDGLVDCLERWWLSVRQRFAHLRTRVLNLDNGPENHSRRPQVMARLLAFAQRFGLTSRLAYYPPDHSQYTPVERCWGILEPHWNGALLAAVAAVTRFTESMTWKGRYPVVALVTTAYPKGVKLTEAAMAEVETHRRRLPGLEKWFVDISPTPIPHRE